MDVALPRLRYMTRYGAIALQLRLRYMLPLMLLLRYRMLC